MRKWNDFTEIEVSIDGKMKKYKMTEHEWSKCLLVACWVRNIDCPYCNMHILKIKDDSKIHKCKKFIGDEYSVICIECNKQILFKRFFDKLTIKC